MSASWGRLDFMANCEHDFGQTVYLQLVRTGNYLYLDAFESAIRHVMDLDIIHFDDHFDEQGGWTAHGAFHVGADGKPNCHLSHMWAEGFLSYYYYSGYTPALESARGVADLICRKVAAGGGRRGREGPGVAVDRAVQRLSGYRGKAVRRGRPDDCGFFFRGTGPAGTQRRLQRRLGSHPLPAGGDGQHRRYGAGIPLPDLRRPPQQGLVPEVVRLSGKRGRSHAGGALSVHARKRDTNELHRFFRPPGKYRLRVGNHR